MIADATLAVTAGWGIRATLVLVYATLCYLAQRQGREVEFECGFAIFRLRYRCGPQDRQGRGRCRWRKSRLAHFLGDVRHRKRNR
jgi:hypothetical protein